MTVLIYKWKVFNQEDIAEAFREFGFDILEYEEPSVYIDEEKGLKFHDYSQLERIIKNVDIVFSFNYFSHISNICEKNHKLYISWSLDSPLISLYNKSIYNKANYIFIFDKFFYYQLKELNLEHLYHLPLAANAKRINEHISKSKNIDYFKSNISFVGSMYHRNSYDKLRPYLPKYLQEYFLEVFEEQLFKEGMEVIDDSLSQEILEKLLNLTEFKQDEDSFSDFDLVFTNTFLGFKLANIERVVTINAIAAALKERGESFSLYTDDYDENLKNVDMRGQLDYRNHMPLVFRNSKINLNISLRNIRSGIPLRVWDILASRGFLLTNNQIELRDYFTDSKDIVIYRNIEDAAKKSLYYLDHDEERERIARNAYENVKNNHSYINRVEKILKIMELK